MDTNWWASGVYPVMKNFTKGSGTQQQSVNRFPSRVWLLAAGMLLVILYGVWLPRAAQYSNSSASVKQSAALAGIRGNKAATPNHLPGILREHPVGVRPSAEQIVAGKLKKFAISRRNLAHALAQRHGTKVPDAVERFFDAMESGNWPKIKAAYDAINGGDGGASTHSPRPPGVQPLWPAIVDAYGAAMEVHLWPPQQLLDYGNAVMDSLSPGMVYVGGTDNGRWIPELMNESSGETPHIIVTQNGLADDGYLDYVNLQYGNQLATLTGEEAAQATQDYLAGYQQRLAHDQQFPDEPPQVLPGESAGISTGSDGQLRCFGPNSQIAVMTINESLLQTLMNQNPAATFALQQSYPFTSTYPDAVPLGPIMELGAPDGPAALTPDLATQSASYWDTTAEQLLADADAADSPSALNAYAKDAASAAALLAAHDYDAEAEQVYRSALQMAPASPDAVMGYTSLLLAQNQVQQAIAVAEAATQAAPDNQQFQNLLVQAKGVRTQ